MSLPGSQTLPGTQYPRRLPARQETSWRPQGSSCFLGGSMFMATPHLVPCPPARSHQSRPLRGTTVLGDTAIPAPCPTLAAAGRVSMGLSQARLVVMDEMEPGTQKSISLKTGNHEAAMCSLAGSREEKRGHTGGGWAGSAAAVPLGPGLSLHSSSQILRSCFCIKVQSQLGAGPRPAAPRG